MATEQLRIVEILYEGFTQLDFTAPHTILSRLPDGHVTVCSLVGGEVNADGGIVFAHTTPLVEVAQCDLLFLPGGITTLDMIGNPEFMAHVRRLGAQAQHLTSVCTGSLILAAAGLIKGRRAACHWAWRDMLPMFGAIVDEARVVTDGPALTGGGVTAGMDFALTLAAKLCGRDVAEALALQIEYAPNPPFARGRPELARPEILAMVRDRMGPMLERQHEQAAASVADAATE